jgi:hypothetical protein
MKIVPKTIAVLFATAMLLSSTAFAAGSNPCSNCYRAYLQCLRGSSDFSTCYYAYEDCLASVGCPIP